MKNIDSQIQNPFLYILSILLGVLLVSLFVTSCSGLVPEDVTPILSTLAPTPEYLQLVTPSGIISQSAYDNSRSSNLVLARGIAVSIWTDRMEVVEKNREWDIISERVTLYLDGKLVSNETLLGGPDGEKGGGLFRLSWAPSLMPGLHEASFQFLSDSGHVLEYKWQFIVEK